MKRVMCAAMLLCASTAAAQRPQGGVGSSQSPSVNTDRVLTITTHGLSLTTPVVELTRNNCIVQSALAEQTIIRCDKDERPDLKDRALALTSTAKDGSGCELIIRFVKATSKWNVEFKSVLGAKCAHTWRDNDSVELRP